MHTVNSYTVAATVHTVNSYTVAATVHTVNSSGIPFLQVLLKHILRQQNSTCYAPYACKTQVDLHVVFDFHKKLACGDTVQFHSLISNLINLWK